MGHVLLSADIISTVEFNHSGELLATGDKGGRVVIFQHEQEVHFIITSEMYFHEQWHTFLELDMIGCYGKKGTGLNSKHNTCLISKFVTQCTSTFLFQCKNRPHLRGEYNVYSTFQSHEPEFDYLKSLEIEEKINKIRWLPQQNSAHFLLSTNGKNILL